MKEREMKQGKRKNGKSLSAKLRRVLIGIILAIVVSFLIALFVFSSKERRASAVRESEGLLNSLSNAIISDIEGYKKLSRLIMIEDRVVAFLRADADEIDREMINEGRYGVFYVLNVTENVDSVFIFREDGTYLSTNRGEYHIDRERMNGDEWDKEILELLGSATYSINGNYTVYRSDGRPVITIGRAVYDLLTQERTGLMLMNISVAVLEKEIRATGNEDICIVDTYGNILAGNADLVKYFDKNQLPLNVVHKMVREKNEDILVSSQKVENIPMVIISKRRLNPPGVPSEGGYLLVFLLLIIVIVVAVAVSFITRNITNPVFKLTASMEKNREEGKLERVHVVSADNEIGMLENSYNNMIDHVNDLIKRLIEKEKILQKAEMRVLHEQIKPHFLYNSLETIGFLAMDAGAENVHAALETLGSFYRNFLSKGDREIPLEREICIVQDYLSLQKLRYGEILRDEYDVADDTKKCIIPKLILQPLVENSIYHGIRLKGEEGVIKIKSRLVNGVLHIYVRDTGVGMSREQIDVILKPRDAAEGETASDHSESFGLWGTIERIRCFCDNEDVVRIRSEEGEYTEVEFIIPQKGTREDLLQKSNAMDGMAQNKEEENDRKGSRKKQRGRKRKSRRKR